ncbi:MAG: hypothetical protein ACUVWJ_08980 [Spirochaetota bacterium]
MFFLFLPLLGMGETGNTPSITVDWIKGSLEISRTAIVSPGERGNVMEGQLNAATTAMEEILGQFIRSMEFMRVDAYNTAQSVLRNSYEKNYRLYQYNERIKKYSLRYDDNRVTVTKKYPFYGRDGFAHLLVRAGEDEGNFPRYPGYKFTAQFSGLIIDARGLGRIPAFAPRIFDEAHNTVFCVDFMRGDSFERWGAVQYTNDPYYRGFLDRVGNNPFRVVAVRNDQLIETDIAISSEDAAILLQHEESKHSLEQGRVIIILDPEVLLEVYK